MACTTKKQNILFWKPEMGEKDCLVGLHGSLRTQSILAARLQVYEEKSCSFSVREEMLTVFKRYKWLALRLGLIALNAIPYGTLNSGGKQFSPQEVLGVFVFSVGVIPLLGVMGRIYGSISGAPNWRSVQWTRPTWGKSPLLLTEPSQFFHLAAFILISIGISRSLVQGEILSSTSSGTFFLADGIGLWIGTWLSVLLVGKGEWEKIGNENRDR